MKFKNLEEAYQIKKEAENFIQNSEIQIEDIAPGHVFEYISKDHNEYYILIKDVGHGYRFAGLHNNRYALYSIFFDSPHEVLNFLNKNLCIRRPQLEYS